MVHMPCCVVAVQGAYVFIPAGAIGLSERLYGPTAAIYDPERWLSPTAATPSTTDAADDVAAGSSDQQQRQQQQAKEVQQAAAGSKGAPPEPMVFSTGPRDCIGQSLARMELQVVVASLVSRFEFKPGTKLAQAVEAAVAGACSLKDFNHSAGDAVCQQGAAGQPNARKPAAGGPGSGTSPTPADQTDLQAAAAVLQGLYDVAEYHITLQPRGGMWLLAHPRG
jgi:hypothetical protein